MGDVKIQNSALGKTLERFGFTFKGVKDFDAYWRLYLGDQTISLILNLSGGVAAFEIERGSDKSTVGGDNIMEALVNMESFFNRKGEFDMSDQFKEISTSLSASVMMN